MLATSNAARGGRGRVSNVHVLGLHVDAARAWVAAVAEDGTLVDVGQDRLELPTTLGSPERALSELFESCSELVRWLDPASIAVLEAGAFSKPPPAEASRGRGRVEAVIMLAAETYGVPIVWVSHRDVGHAFGVRPADRELPKQLADRLGGSKPPPKWSDRARAFAVALVALGAGATVD